MRKETSEILRKSSTAATSIERSDCSERIINNKQIN